MVKPLSMFQKEKRSKDGHRYECKECKDKIRRDWYAKNREEINLKKRLARAKDAGAGALYAQNRRIMNPARELVQRAKRRATIKGLPYNLDKHLDALTKRVEPMVCEMSGIKMVMRSGPRDYNSLSLDRINPKKGYIYNNVRVICWGVNAAMGTWGEDVMKELFKKL